MSPGKSPLFFRIKSRSVSIAPGLTVRGYSAEAALELWVEDDPPGFRSYHFQLDTKSDVTTIPEEWVKENRRRFGPLSRLVTLSAQTPVGRATVNGRLARGVRFRFVGEDTASRIDVLVSSHLSTNYGLLSLRDLHNHYWVWTEGDVQLEADGSPLQLGYLYLKRRQNPPPS
jgi:hypothetical protein